MYHLALNIKALRKKQGLTQSQLADAIGVKTNTISNYENGISAPDFILLEKIIKILDVDTHDILYSDLTDVNFKSKCAKKVVKNIDHIIDHKNDHYPNVQKKWSNKVVTEHSNIQTFSFDDDNFTEVPIADISVAAGGGSVNSDYYEVNGSIRLPKSMLRSKGTLMCVKVDGRSMEPTLPHASKVIIRLLDRCEWHNIKDNQVYVVTDREGGTYIKRCTNKLHSEGVIVLMSDNAAFSPITLTEGELHNIWVVELFMMFDLPNKRTDDDLWRSSMEGEVSEIKQQLAKVLRVINKDNLKRS